MNTLFKSVTLALILSLSLPVMAQSQNDMLSKIIGSRPTVEINLGKMMLGLLSSASEDDEGISQVLSGLDSIKVTVFELENTNKIESLKSTINELAKVKVSEGYESLAKVKEEDSLVYVFAKMDNKNFKSLSVFALDDDDEFVIINIDGTLLLSQLGKLMEHFDVDLDINGLKLKNSTKKDD